MKHEALWHHIDIHEATQFLRADLKNGLSASEVKSRQEQYGLNKLSVKKRVSEWLRFLLQFKQPLMYILIIASIITFVLGEMVDSLVIFGVVLINGIVGYLQEAKAEKAIDALSKMVTTQATVLRAGQRTRISSIDVVPGDIVFLQSGDKVPADLRLFHVHNLQVDESALTGESVPVEKRADVLKQDLLLADRRNMVFAGTLVNMGIAQGLVCLTGDKTELGKIARLTNEATDLSTPLTQKIEHFSRFLLVAILGLALLTFVVGVMRGNAIIDMFMAAVALAVGAIPEGLPAAVTITLAIGVSRMARRKAIIRKLPAVETLGSTTVICTDKTGTLTQNRMTVQVIYAGDKAYDVAGNGYEGGHIHIAGQPVILDSNVALKECLLAGLLCNESRLIESSSKYVLEGDPTEGALIVSARKAGVNEQELAERFPRVGIIPFESEHQYMATLHDVQEEEHLVYIKGAAEKIIEKCTKTMDGQGQWVTIDKVLMRKVSEEMASRGLRVLAFAMRKLPKQGELSHRGISRDLVFLGLQAMIDPPRQEAIEAVRKCQEAGIQVKMVTGDHVLTAAAIAKQIGLLGCDDSTDCVVSGAQLGKCPEAELSGLVQKAVVFARIVPEQKLHIVQALQANGHVVTMTGDGVNDAPALKQANVGTAMGIAGTDVAKGAADMVITDDNFHSIEMAIEEGRGVFDNLTKFIVWTLPTNIGEAMLLTIAILLGLTLPALPVQLLWVNMMTAIFLGLMLVFEPKEADIMRRPPRNPDKPILTFDLLMRTGFVVLLMLLGTNWFFVRALNEQGMSLEQARTIVINVIVIVEIFYLFNCRSLTKPIFLISPFSNVWVIVGSMAMIGMQVLFTHTPLMNRFFHTASIPLWAWIEVFGVGLFVFVLVEVEKWLRVRWAKANIRK